MCTSQLTLVLVQERLARTQDLGDRTALRAPSKEIKSFIKIWKKSRNVSSLTFALIENFDKRSEW